MQEVPWTARHAFFADMGGLRVKCPDFPEFPISSNHLFWLVENGHIAYPQLEEKTIMDKNKADTLTRGIMLLQATWFAVEVVARAIQHLSITTLELSTLAFACSTLHSLWFWQNKPLDVVEPITLLCEKNLRAIHSEAETRLDRVYTTSPLEFLDREAHLSYVEPFFFGLDIATNQEYKASDFPVLSFSNGSIGHKDVKRLDVVYGILFMILYFGIHLAAWPFHFPSYIELLLWRISAITLACIAVIYEVVCCSGKLVGKYFFPGSPKYAIEIVKMLPKWVTLSLMWPLIIAYFTARSYIIVEGFVSLRALPATAFQYVDWLKLVPHF